MTSVDGVGPDENGNVELNAVKSVDDVTPDANGNVALNAVKSVNEEAPDEYGDVEIDVGVLTINNTPPDANGNFDLDGVVLSVNNEVPDSNGNVEVDVGVKTIDNTSPDANGNINLTAYAKSVNNYLPDANGNITVPNIDTSNCVLITDINNNTTQGRTGVAGYYYANIAYTGTLPGGLSNLYDWVGAYSYQTLDEEITDLGYIKEDDLGDLAYLDTVTVDGHESDSSGVVSFNLTGSKWVVTDANGHLATTNDVPLVVNPSSTGYLYSTNGTISYKDEQYVDMTTAQIVAGVKTWVNNAIFGGTVHVSTDNNWGSIHLENASGSSFVNVYGRDSSIIGFGTNVGTTSTITKTSFITAIQESGAGSIHLTSGTGGVNINAPADFATLTNAPTGNAGNAIATVGYITNELGSYVKTVNEIEPDPTGNVALGEIVYSVNGEAPDEDGDEDLGDIVNSVQGISPDSNGNVSFNLAGNKWMKTDAYGGLSTTNDTPYVVPSSTGWLYNNNGTIQYLTDAFVDLVNAQTVGGSKTWTSNAYFRSIVQINNGTDLSHTFLSWFPTTGNPQFKITGTQLAEIQLGLTATGGATGTIYNTLTGLTVSAGNNLLSLAGAGGIYLDGAADSVLLHYSPTSSAPNTAVATVGWTKDQMGSYVKSVNNIGPDQNGNVTYTPDLSSCVLVSDINQVHQGRTAVSGYTYANAAYTGNLHGAMDNIYNWVGAYSYQSLDAEMTALGYVKDSDIVVDGHTSSGGTVSFNLAASKWVKTDGNGHLTTTNDQPALQVDGHNADAQGAVNFNLTASKWVKTDANGHLTTTNDTPIAVDTSQWTP